MNDSVYKMVTDRIIEQLSQGIIPWQKPWTGVKGGAFNRISKKSYSLLNQMLLKHSGEYATFKQWSGIGASVRKGETAEKVVFWKIFPIEETQKDGSIKVSQVPFLKYINVFHISQVDNAEPLDEGSLKDNEIIEKPDKILKDYWERENINVKHIIGNEAFYSVTGDYIQLPSIEQFTNSNLYYATAFHESVHSTLPEHRCNRKSENILAAFGSEDYSKEELVAEIGSASLMNLTGIETPKTIKNNAAYIQSWLKVLKNDVKFIVSAGGKAEKAVNYILGEDKTL